MTERQSPVKTMLRTLKERAARPVAALTLAGIALAGCSDGRGHDLHLTGPIVAKDGTVDAVIFGDSITYRAALYGNYKAKLRQAGINPRYIGGFEGRAISGKPSPSMIEVVTGNTPEARKVQAAIKDPKTEIVAVLAGTNPILEDVDHQQFRRDIRTLNEAIYRLNPKAVRYMGTMATNAPQRVAEMSARNQDIYEMARDPKYGYDVIDRASQLYPGSTPLHLSPYSRNQSIDQDVVHIHETTRAGWEEEADITVSTLKLALKPHLTWLAPQYEPYPLRPQ